MVAAVKDPTFGKFQTIQRWVNLTDRGFKATILLFARNK